MISKAKEAEYNALSVLGEARIEALLEAMKMYKDNLRIEQKQRIKYGVLKEY